MNKEVILCVDDEETSLRLRKPVLEKAGYEVLTSASAAQAGCVRLPLEAWIANTLSCNTHRRQLSL